jgi:hypothetical protein
MAALTAHPLFNEAATEPEALSAWATTAAKQIDQDKVSCTALIHTAAQRKLLAAFIFVEGFSLILVKKKGTLAL